jgi:SAM-dependent methyltransferase
MNETERRAADLIERARAWWTPERQQNLLGGKHLVLRPVESAPVLRAIGLLNGDGSMAPQWVRKFMQVNHMIALLEPLMLDLTTAHERVEVLDLGCGSSHLTLLLAWCFAHRWKHPAEIRGVDRNPALVEACRKRAELSGLTELVSLRAAWIAELDASPGFPGQPHAVVALHACDTASCEAIAFAIRKGADLIAVAPCCQAELSRKWAELGVTDPAIAPILGSPHLRRELAATTTDAMRMLLLRASGYRTTAMEFVPSGHTPKNTLLRAVRIGSPDPEAAGQYSELVARFGGADIRLAELLDQACSGGLDRSRHAGRP